MRIPGLLALLAAAAALNFAQPAQANLLIQVNKHTQKMTVTVDGDPRYVWPVSTGIAQYDTPNGQYTPFRMEKDHFSKEWDDAPMPYSIFFTKQGHAIHGTNHKIDGLPHSHGCVRLSVAHAAVLWDLVKQEGMQNVRVELTGRIPDRTDLIARRDQSQDADDQTSSIERRPDFRDDRQARVYAGDDDDVTGSVPQSRPPGVWRQYREGNRVYYYRDGADEEQRLPRRYYRPQYDPRYSGYRYW
jgi:hypothetical protein